MLCRCLTLTWCFWVTAAAVPIAGLAHEGHDVIPSKGITVKGNTVLISPEARRAIDLRTANVETRGIQRSVLVPAVVVLQPQAQAFATTPLSGRIEKIFVTPGQKVKAGETVALVRSLELERLQSAVFTHRLEVEMAEQTRQRSEELAERGILSQQELLSARLRKQELVNQLLVAELKIEALGLRQEEGHEIGLLPMRSPIDGVVAHVDITPGAIVDTQMHPLEILDASRVWLRADVPEAYVNEIAVGNSASIQLNDASSGRTSQTNAARAETRRFHGIVRARQGAIDAKTLAEPVWIEMEEDDPALIPGRAGLARLVVEIREKALLIPETAVVRDGMETYVFVQLEPGKYERTSIVAGIQSGGHVEVVSGIFSIDAVVTQGNRQLSSFFVQGVLRPSAEARRATGLRIEPVTTRAISEVLVVDAIVELPPHGKAIVAALLEGRVTELLVHRPQEVAAGQPLARLVSLEIQNIQMELVQADLNAKLQEEVVASYRKADPQQKGLVGRQAVQEAELKLKIALNKIASLRRQLQTIGMTEEEIDAVVKDHLVAGSLMVRSPRQGFVIPRALALGKSVHLGEALFEVQDRSHMWVRGWVFEQDLSKIQSGEPARVYLTSAPTFVQETSLSRIGGMPEEDGRTRAIWAEVTNESGLLRENQLAQLAISVGPALKRPAVPLTALYRQGSHHRAFVYDEAKDLFEVRRVEIGRQDDRFVEIKRGLKPGESIAVSAAADLQRGYGRIK